MEEILKGPIEDLEAFLKNVLTTFVNEDHSKPFYDGDREFIIDMLKTTIVEVMIFYNEVINRLLEEEGYELIRLAIKCIKVELLTHINELQLLRGGLTEYDISYIHNTLMVCYPPNIINDFVEDLQNYVKEILN